MSTPLPSSSLFACFPLQEYFVNKDTGFPLSSGYVEFFADDQFTVPKDVYQYSYSANVWTPVNLGPVLRLGIAGTFVNQNGDDIIPFLFPYDGTPDNTTGTVELYFIRVWSGDPSVQGSVLQFTRQGWPPNLAQSTDPIDTYESSNNGFTNPEFSIVNFTENPATGKCVIAISGTPTTINIAPGWKITCSGTGNLSLKQILLTGQTNYTPNPSYAIQIESDIGVTQIKLIQTLNHSPRVYFGTYLSVAVLAASISQTIEAVNVTFDPKASGTSHIVLSGQTTSNTEFDLLAGVNGQSVLIGGTANNSTPDTGYVDMVIDVPSGRIMQYTSFLMVTVQNANSLIPYIQSTNAEQTNAMFWYYKPELEYKPIPSYTLGWDFAMNPFQAEGTAAFLYNPSAPGKSVYIADQTILFQSTVNRIRASKAAGTLNLEVVGGNTSFALVQYLGANEAMELLNNPICSQLRSKIDSGTLRGQVNLYYTTNATLPSLSANSATGGDSIVTAVDTTTATPTVPVSWTVVPRSNLGTPYFTLSSTMTSFDFNGWATNVTNATFFAIVISFAEAAENKIIQVQHCSLQKGYIPTAPAALSFGETLAGLQQYYESSYNIGTIPGSITGNPPYITGTYSFTSISTSASSYGIVVPFKQTKRTSPTWDSSTSTYNLNIYDPLVGGATPNRLLETGGTARVVTAAYPSENNFYFVWKADAGPTPLATVMYFDWVADVRYGIQN
jgi:hypothetical protein